MKLNLNLEGLRQKLLRMDGRGYKAYKEIQGSYRGEGFWLHIDHVQADPFASPSRVRVEIPREVARYPDDWYQPLSRKVAFEDFIAREAGQEIRGDDRVKRPCGVLPDGPAAPRSAAA
ncbi:MAG: ABC-ATPase domain-containing protein, partial [Syntrophomonadaceae bacterium]|nr:ABC-ATPase domain-containing protein [Syntrophomonadaceae bacterium]